jgi:hypothetical protein
MGSYIDTIIVNTLAPPVARFSPAGRYLTPTAEMSSFSQTLLVLTEIRYGSSRHEDDNGRSNLVITSFPDRDGCTA